MVKGPANFSTNLEMGCMFGWALSGDAVRAPTYQGVFIAGPLDRSAAGTPDVRRKTAARTKDGLQISGWGECGMGTTSQILAET